MSDESTIELRLLSGFELRVDQRRVELPMATQRVLALLAIQGRPQSRSSVAATLWIDSPENRAAANLRSALWKLRDLRDQVLDTSSKYIHLGPRVKVDIGSLVQCARELIDSQRPSQEPVATAIDPPRAELFAEDLLPEWDEDWILFERERLRQLRIHAMEALTYRLRAEGRFAEAVDAGLSAISADPLRESAHRALIDVYLAEGNVVDARRQFDRYHRVLWDELGVMPSADLCELLGTMFPAGTAGREPGPPPPVRLAATPSAARRRAPVAREGRSGWRIRGRLGWKLVDEIVPNWGAFRSKDGTPFPNSEGSTPRTCRASWKRTPNDAGNTDLGHRAPFTRGPSPLE